MFKTTKEAALAASELGFKRVNETVNGQAIFQKGNSYITRDVDGHNSGAWKMADSVKELTSKETRSGTYNTDLTKRIGD
ncbi:MAG: toxin C-terminal domain-containing protein [Methylomonas lenta]|nr:toxin C-terminal domain-containing protein [Methylomonas lenta]